MKVKDVEVTNSTTSFKDLVARSLKIESNNKKKKSGKLDIDESNKSSHTSASESSQSFDSNDDDKRKKTNKHCNYKRSSKDKTLELLTKRIKELTAYRE